MSIDVLVDYPAGNRMQGLCVSLSKDNITVSGYTPKEKLNKFKALPGKEGRKEGKHATTLV